jgi:hypothetical protein
MVDGRELSTMHPKSTVAFTPKNADFHGTLRIGVRGWLGRCFSVINARFP